MLGRFGLAGSEGVTFSTVVADGACGEFMTVVVVVVVAELDFWRKENHAADTAAPEAALAAAIRARVDFDIEDAVKDFCTRRPFCGSI